MPKRVDETGEYFLDELAVSVADGTISRARAIKLVGVALLGSVLAVFLPAEDAEARRRSFRQRCRRRGGFVCHSELNGRQCCTGGKSCDSVNGCICTFGC
jgi:hypothetical protein